MTTKIFCPFDNSELTRVGDIGIVHYDGDWDVQASRWECAEGKHVLFVVDPKDVEDELEPAYKSAELAVEVALRSAAWTLRRTVLGMSNSYVQLRSNLAKDFGSLEEPLKSPEDLRNALAQRAVSAFRDSIEDSDLPGTSADYDYIHAMEYVDEVLEREEFGKQLKEAGWLLMKPQKT